MNIWYFCLDPRPSSTDTTSAPSIHIMETVRALAGQGHNVQHFLYGDAIREGEQALRKSAQGVGQNNYLFQKIKPLLRDVYELYQDKKDVKLVEPIFQNGSIDFVYERLSQHKSAVSVCTQKYNVPLIIESNAPVEERKAYWGAPLFPLTKRLERKIVQRADALTVMSSPLKQYYAQEMGVAEDKIHVLPNGVNPNRFSSQTVNRNIRAELGLENKVIIGFVGNIFAYHGLELFLPLAEANKSAQERVHFMIIGSGEGRDDLRAALKQAGLDKLFTFVDPVPNAQIPNYLSAMDICLLPRFMWYGSPMKIFEYGVMGKAIVAPNQENIRDVLTHAETAYLFEPGNTNALIKAVQELVADEKFRLKLGQAVKEHILNNHTWSHNAQKILRIHQKIIH